MPKNKNEELCVLFSSVDLDFYSILLSCCLLIFYVPEMMIDKIRK